MTSLQFLARPKNTASHFFGVAGASRTILVSSHIWWVDCIATALHQLGWNVLVTEPWYVLFTADELFNRFDECWDYWLTKIRKHDVDLILAGNSTALVPHPKTGELLHEAAGIPLVNYWWDEPRQIPPLMRRGHSLQTYLAALRSPTVFNAVWDADIAQEMTVLFGLRNVTHIPLGTMPELWPALDLPMARRPLAANFLGNCFHHDDWRTAYDPALLARVEAVAARKAADLDRSMIDCVKSAANAGACSIEHFSATDSSDAPLQQAVAHWGAMEMVLRQRLRYDRVRALAKHLGSRLIICGKGWESLCLKSHKEHSGVPGATDYYLNSKASINLFGGCVHAGMPLRPYEIACSNGLIVTQYNRELPDLFDIGSECLAFRNDDEMIQTIDRVLAAPAEFDRVIVAGRKRVLAEHTWKHRMARLMALAAEQFSLPV